MSKIFENAEPLILQTVNSYFDGLPVWDEHKIKGRVVSESFGLTGANRSEIYFTTTFLISPEYRMPKPGDRIKYNNALYEVSLVEKKRNLSGAIISHRCICGKL
ncbi:MAG: hypothetical protein IJW08_03575 [Lentisphaeria bacterium]|nr:hypothetical protein [Lentisphaeria bacterium]MBR7119121.1 hypothetical protein [Lentisphaeria bacterium]